MIKAILMLLIFLGGCAIPLKITVYNDPKNIEQDKDIKKWQMEEQKVYSLWEEKNKVKNDIKSGLIQKKYRRKLYDCMRRLLIGGKDEHGNIKYAFTEKFVEELIRDIEFSYMVTSKISKRGGS